jgi:hypothetical protein
MSGFAKHKFTPTDGFLNESFYPNPETGEENREQHFSLHKQTRDFINGHIAELESREPGLDGKSSGADRIGSSEIPGLIDPNEPGALAKTVRDQILSLFNNPHVTAEQISENTYGTVQAAIDIIAAAVAAEVIARVQAVEGIEAALALKNALLVQGSNILITDNGDGTQTISVIGMDLFIIVAELPSVGLPNKIYLVPDASGQEYQEYYWDPEKGAWDNFGALTVDLANYYTKAQTDSAIATAFGGPYDCGDWDDPEIRAAIAAHNKNPLAHPDMTVDGGEIGGEIEEAIEAHNEDISSHGNLIIDGGEA